MQKRFKRGELFVYANGERFEIGKVKSPNAKGDGYFCWYHEGSTAANTPARCMHKLANAYVIKNENLGGLDGWCVEGFQIKEV